VKEISCKRLIWSRVEVSMNEFRDLGTVEQLNNSLLQDSIVNVWNRFGVRHVVREYQAHVAIEALSGSPINVAERPRYFFFTITTSSVPSLRKLTCDRFARGASPEKWLSRLTARAACRTVSSSNGVYSSKR